MHEGEAGAEGGPGGIAVGFAGWGVVAGAGVIAGAGAGGAAGPGGGACHDGGQGGVVRSGSLAESVRRVSPEVGPRVLA